MIIPDSFRNAYNNQIEGIEKLKYEVDGIFDSMLKVLPNADYRSRIKELESTFNKVLLGEYKKPFVEMHDIFGCVLTVSNINQIEIIRQEIPKYFDIVTIKERDLPKPFEFKYTDLHLKLSLKDSSLLTERSLLNYRFELQIKSLLQSAWWQASHDSVYKAQELSWRSERVAGQLRALLELADNVLARIEETAQLLHFQEEEIISLYKNSEKGVIQTFQKYWSESELPADKGRMAETILYYLSLAEASKPISKLDSLLRIAQKSSHPVLSYKMIPPMQKIFILLYQKHSSKINKNLKRFKRQILITQEMLDYFPELGDISDKIIYEV